MADAGVLLLVHGEVTDPEVDMFDREAVFIREKLVGIRNTEYAYAILVCDLYVPARDTWGAACSAGRRRSSGRSCLVQVYKRWSRCHVPGW